MVKGLDKGVLRVAVYAAASLMFGALPAVWLRILDAVAGRTVYSLTVCAGLSMAGLAVGFAGAGLLFRKVRRTDAALCAVLLLAGCCLAVQLAMSNGIVDGWQRILNDLSRSAAQYGTTLVKTAAFLVFLPSLLAGCAVRLPLMAFLRSPERQRGQALTLTVLLGVLPASVGYGLAAGMFVPWVGVEGMMRLAAIWFGVLASCALMARGAWSVLPFLVVAGVLAGLNPRGRVSLLTDGVFSRLVHRDSGFARGTPMFTHRSRHHTVSVYDDVDYNFVFSLDGRPVLFGNRFHTARTVTGYLPLLLRPECKRAAYFGPEAGFYLPFSARAGVAEIAYAGADPDVVKLALAADSYLVGDGGDVTEKAHRGATLSPKENYDLVFLASEPVWMRGTGAAYSRGLFKRCRGALSDDGIVALHLDARALSPKRFATIARLFAQEFPDMQIWCTGAYDWLLVGGKKAFLVPVDKMLALFEREAVVRDFARAGVLSLPEVLACLLCERPGLTAWLERTGTEMPCKSAWFAPLSVFGAGVHSLKPSDLEPCRQRVTGWLQPGAVDDGVCLAIRAKTEQCVGARALSVIALAETSKGLGDAGLSAARAASKLNSRDVLLMQLAETLELEGRRRIAIGEFKGALKCFENLLSFAPGTARAHYGMGYSLRANGENESAYLHFARAVAAAPEQTGYRMELAQVALMIGEFAEADRQFQEVLKREPNNPDALFRYARGLSAKDRPNKDMEKAVKLAEKACVVTRWNNREYAFGLANLYMEAGRVMEGMGLKRRLKEAGK